MRSLLFIVGTACGAGCITSGRAPNPPDGLDTLDSEVVETAVEATGEDAEASAETTVPPCVGPGDCDDHNACTIDTCEVLGGCQHVPASDGTSCTRADVVAGCHDLVFQAPSHCDGQGACVAESSQNCAAPAAPTCQRPACDASLGCRSEPVDDGTACTIADNFSDTCVGGEHHLVDRCASGVCQDGYSEPCPVGYCEVATCDGKTCSTGDMGRDATIVTAPWAFNAYVRASDGSPLALWRGRATFKTGGTWTGSVAARGNESANQDVGGTYCLSADGELSLRFTSTAGLGALTFRGVLSANDDLGVAWDDSGTAFMLLNQVVTLPLGNLRGHAFRALGFDPTDGASSSFIGKLSVDQTSVVTGSWTTTSAQTLTVVGTVTLLQPSVLLSIKVGAVEQTWHAINAGTTGVTWFVRHRADSEEYEDSLLVLVEEPAAPASSPSLEGRFRFGALDFDRAPIATHGDTEIGDGVVASLREVSPEGTVWRMPVGPDNVFLLGADGGFLQTTVGPASSTVRRSGQLGIWVDNAAGFFVDVESAPPNVSDGPIVPAAPHFRFGFRPH